MSLVLDGRGSGGSGQASEQPRETGSGLTQQAQTDETLEQELLLDEIERLRHRIADLEFSVAEYRHQVGSIVTSASWRMTSPMRAIAARVRSGKVRARRAARALRHGRRADDEPKLLTAGLFMPPLTDLPETSPLRTPLDVNALHRSPDAPGPLTRPEGDPRILVVAHVHYPELWGDIEDRLARMPEPYDLICTVTEGHAASAISHIMARHPRARIEIVPNRGRDWAPLVRLANKGLLSGYDAIAKVHTKKSEHRIDGDSWRLALLDGIFESRHHIRTTIDLLKKDRSVGLVVPTGHVAYSEHWGSNQGIVEALAARLPMAFDPDALAFPAGSMFWCRPWVLECLADLCISDEHFEPEAGQFDATTAHALERIIGIFSAVAGMDIIESADVRHRQRSMRATSQKPPKIYAFYLPQYHQCPENNEFWGEGFTDWVNVKAARPLFKGHQQPLRPSPEMGYYDLSDPEVLRKQAHVAKGYGVGGFIFHYYWFDGRKVLNTPLDNWLADPSIDLPIALCWANESWTRRWDGLDNEVLIPQSYTNDWADRIWDDVAPALLDPRYLTVDDLPIFAIYRLGQIPNARDAIRRWRARAQQDGLNGIRILSVLPPMHFEPIPAGLATEVDGAIEFAPHSGNVTRVRLPDQLTFEGSPNIWSYQAYSRKSNLQTGMVRMPGVMPGWDNTARRGNDANLFFGSNPISWRGHLAQAISDGAATVFVNAWNEWAEGAVLEPSARFGSSFAAAIADCVGTS